MQAVILAGGKGTRLRPYTTVLPKPLVPIGDYPILEIIIKQLKSFGFNKIIISTGHLAELIEAYFGNGDRWGVNIEYVREYTPLNTAGALKLIPNCEENFLVMNGDVLTTLDYQKLFEDHLRSGAAATISTVEREANIDFGVVVSNEEGFLTEYIEKPTYRYVVSMGVNVLSKASIDLINDGEALGMPDLMSRIKQSGKNVYCYKSNVYWLDIGRGEDYEKAQEGFELHKSEFLRHE